MLSALQRKIHRNALGAFLSFGIGLTLLIASPVFVAGCAGSTSCG